MFVPSLAVKYSLVLSISQSQSARFDGVQPQNKQNKINCGSESNKTHQDNAVQVDNAKMSLGEANVY